MTGVWIEADNEIVLEWENGEQISCSTSEFFNERLTELVNSGNNVIYAKGLKLWGMSFLYVLNKHGYTDDTQFRLVSNTTPGMSDKHYAYVVSAKTNTWFNIQISGEGDNSLLIFAYENMVPITDELLIKDFCDGCEYIGDAAKGMLKAITYMREVGCTGTTVSGSAMSLWKSGYNKYDFESLFRAVKGDEYFFIRSAYHGGLCYVNKHGKCGSGIVLDCNSLYPYVMLTSWLPIGKGKWFDGEPKKLWQRDEHYGYFVRFTCRFNIKPDHVPFVRIADSDMYRYDEVLKTSDVIDTAIGDYCSEYVDEWGEIHPIRATLTMWKDEFELFKEQYDIEDLQFIGGYKYNCWDKVFKNYVNRFSQMKENAEDGSHRRIAKILQAALSGNLAKRLERESVYFEEYAFETLEKFGGIQKNRTLTDRQVSNDNTRKGYLEFTGEEAVKSLATSVKGWSRSKSYINIGAAITSIGMCITVRAAQANYEHFKYTDTDSLHLDCGIEDVKGIEIDNKKLGKWKIEHEFDSAVYIQPKVYYLDEKETGALIKWAGMEGMAQDELEKLINWLKRDGLPGNEYMVGIRNKKYEMLDFKTFKKSIVYNEYGVDIRQFL